MRRFYGVKFSVFRRQRRWRDFWTDSKSVIMINLEYRYQRAINNTYLKSTEEAGNQGDTCSGPWFCHICCGSARCNCSHSPLHRFRSHTLFDQQYQGNTASVSGGNIVSSVQPVQQLWSLMTYWWVQNYRASFIINIHKGYETWISEWNSSISLKKKGSLFTWLSDIRLTLQL